MQEKLDSKGIPYTAGNRHLRRFLAVGKKTRSKTWTLNKRPNRGNLLPLELREHGKSKFLHTRLRQEKKENICELYK